MKKILLITLIFLNTLLAQGLNIAVGISIAPYVIKENNSGFQIELIKQVLEEQGMDVDYLIYASNNRITKLLKNKEVDAALNLQPNLKNVYYSDVITNFKNVAITLKERDITVKSVDDLHHKRVYGFQRAHKFLGEKFAQYAKNNPLYTETVQQLSQVKHLSERRIDVAVADQYVFLYYKNQSNYKDVKFEFFDIFPKSPRYMGFKDEKIRDAFNEGLKKFKETRNYEKLLEKYQIKGE